MARISAKRWERVEVEVSSPELPEGHHGHVFSALDFVPDGGYGEDDIIFVALPGDEEMPELVEGGICPHCHRGWPVAEQLPGSALVADTYNSDNEWEYLPDFLIRVGLR